MEAVPVVESIEEEVDEPVAVQCDPIKALVLPSVSETISIRPLSYDFSDLTTDKIYQYQMDEETILANPNMITLLTGATTIGDSMQYVPAYSDPESALATTNDTPEVDIFAGDTMITIDASGNATSEDQTDVPMITTPEHDEMVVENSIDKAEDHNSATFASTNDEAIHMGTDADTDIGAGATTPLTIRSEDTPMTVDTFMFPIGEESVATVMASGNDFPIMGNSIDKSEENSFATVVSTSTGVIYMETSMDTSAGNTTHFATRSEETANIVDPSTHMIEEEPVTVMTTGDDCSIVENPIDKTEEHNFTAACNEAIDTVTCMDTSAGATSPFAIKPDDTVMTFDPSTHPTEENSMATVMSSRNGYPVIESSLYIDQISISADLSHNAIATTDSRAASKGISILVDQLVVESSEAENLNLGAKSIKEHTREMRTEDAPSIDIYMTKSTDSGMEDPVACTAEPSGSESTRTELFPDEMPIVAKEIAEKPQEDLVLISNARLLAKPTPLAQRRGKSSGAPTTSSSLDTQASSPKLAEDGQPKTSVPSSDSANRPQPQLGPARLPKKSADPFIRKKPARKTHAEKNTQASTGVKTPSETRDPLARKSLAGEISKKRGPCPEDRQEGHSSIESGQNINVALQDATIDKNPATGDPVASHEDSKNKRSKMFLLASSSVVSVHTSANDEVRCSSSTRHDAPVLFEERGLQAARAWTPLQDLTQDQAIKQINDWLFTDTQFYRKVDECTMTKNFGAFTDFDFEKLLKQCHWTTTWLNEQHMAGTSERLFEKTQLRRTADYVKSLCSAFSQGKVKNWKNNGKLSSDRIEVVHMINGLECRGSRTLTKEEKKKRDEELDNDKAIDVKNIQLLMEWAEDVLKL